MIYTIENEFLRVSAEDDGAQLSSIELKETGKSFSGRAIRQSGTAERRFSFR